MKLGISLGEVRFLLVVYEVKFFGCRGQILGSFGLYYQTLGFRLSEDGSVGSWMVTGENRFFERKFVRKWGFHAIICGVGFLTS